jgi:hypothetical protein
MMRVNQFAVMSAGAPWPHEIYGLPLALKLLYFL